MFAIRATFSVQRAPLRDTLHHAWVSDYRHLRRDSDPESPFIGEFRIHALAGDSTGAILFADRSDAQRIADNIVGPFKGQCDVVKVGTLPST